MSVEEEVTVNSWKNGKSTMVTFVKNFHRFVVVAGGSLHRLE